MKRSGPLRSDPEKAKQWKQRSARKYAGKRRRSSKERERYRAAALQRVNETDGRCCADGMHHPDCPGQANVTHHILPREHGGDDSPENLLPVWGGISGADGCHGRIHRERTEAIERGYLRRRDNIAQSERDQ